MGSDKTASLDAAQSCAYCALPIGRLGQQREVDGTVRAFCCYGCCLAYQVQHGEREEPQAAALLIRLGVGGFLMMNIVLFSLLTYTGALAGADAWLKTPVQALMWLLATPLVVLLGAPFYVGAWQALRQGRLTTDALVSIGVLAAYGYSVVQLLRGSDLVYFDTASMVLVLFTLGRYIEAQGRVRAARSLAPMLAAERAEVRVVSAGESGAGAESSMGSCIESTIPVRDVEPGMLVRVLPGERFAVDGVVVEGRSDCNESILTGQPQARAKTAGALVYAGSINGSGPLLIRATVAGTQTRWIQISRLVRAALARKSMTGEAVDRVVAVFIPGVLLLALATAWFWSGRAGFDVALMAGLAVLVVACPCALGLAAPLANALAIGAAAQRGILVRSGGVVERLARLKGVAFDKTGTLTYGEFRPLSVCVESAPEEEVLGRARALAAGSDHPMARAICALTASRHATEPLSVQRLEVRPGAGVLGDIDQVPCALGSAALMAMLGWSLPQSLQASAARGGTYAYVGWAGRVHGCITFADTPTPEAKDVIATLHGQRLQTLLLSGDTPNVVAQVAAALAIPQWRAQLLPEDKVRLLHEWIDRHGPVAMVGDGLNDGPVLAAASVGIAVGAASDLAKESADVVLPRGGLVCLPWLLQQAAHARRSLRANLIWAFAYNAVALSLAAGALLQPGIAAALMAGSSLLIALRSWHASRRDDVAEALMGSPTTSSRREGRPLKLRTLSATSVSRP
ncbi:MAG TPA: heavy metal translocating P-type ATPase [Burkholderiaceae bacterium]|nr:heavy metal translocating P-type ATPase [Burkholderiaceae bacterium]